MARRSRSTNEESTTPEEQTITEGDVATIPAEVIEGGESSEEKPEKAEKAPEEPIDLTEFEAALATAIKAADESTGTVAPADREPVVAAYRALSGAKAKAKARAVPEDKMREAMVAGDFMLARTYMELKDGLLTTSSGGGAKRERVPANPTEAFVEQSAALRIGTSILESTAPEGIDEGWEESVGSLIDSTSDEVASYVEYLNTAEDDRGEAPEVSQVVQRAVKLAAGRAAGRRTGGNGSRAPYTGARRDVAKHILEAFEDAENGAFLTVAQIVNNKSSEYGDDKPSAGAVSARLFPKDKPCNIEGVTPGNGPDGKSRGAYKGAAA